MEIRYTNDGSQTLFSDKYGETYHSSFGAITESLHVFIEAGFNLAKSNPLQIFEMGFGTGLNAILTLKLAFQKNVQVKYHAIELHPVPLDFIMNFEIESNLKELFLKLHEAEWNKSVPISPNFELNKIKKNLIDWQPAEKYNIIYFDAFSPESQPELWTHEIFTKAYNMLYSGGILTTYCAKGYVRRNLIAAGFNVERLPGPPGKREMLRAIK